MAVKAFGRPSADQLRPVGCTAVEGLRQAFAMGFNLGIERQHRRCAFGKTRIPEQMLGHQKMVQRTVDAFEEQAHVALVVFG